MKNKLNTFIEKAKKTHGDKYDYTKVEYKDSTTKVCIICPEHGEFWQTPAAHVRGNECPICANEKRGKRGTKEEFIEKAKQVHGNKYDYTYVEYKNATSKVCIKCPEHGEFWQTPAAHLSGQGCPKCVGRSQTQDEIISTFKNIHGDKYDYSKTVIKSKNEKVCIICPIHGEFWITPSKHLVGRGCPKCGVENRTNLHRCSQDSFIDRAKAIYGDRYDYSKVNFREMAQKVEIICRKHGSFLQRPYDHLMGHGCPSCGNNESKSEKELYEYVCNLIGKENVVYRDKTLIPPYEIDIYIPSLKIGIEYNGLRWHGENFGKDNKYHLNKTEMCKKLGVGLIQIFEDEYINKKDIVLNKIKHLLKKDAGKEKIYARNCIVKEISKQDAEIFLNKNHIQGFVGSSLYIGAYFENTIIGVMTFKKCGNNKWELTRFATDISKVSCGVGGKLFKYFIQRYNPNEVKSFADRRWTINEKNNLYTMIGFNFSSYTRPDYRYFKKEDGNIRHHKFAFRKKLLYKRYQLPLNMTESEMTKSIGYEKIWDCGLIKYIWKQK